MTSTLKKILVVEDEVPILNVLVDRFTQEGFVAIGAKDGKEGLELALKEIPDVILLDIVMPTMDGMEMLGKLRQTPTGANTPVILLTNVGETSKILDAKDLRVVDYLIKSNFKIEQVVSLVKEKLNSNFIPTGL